jgi:hypothetical protein
MEACAIARACGETLEGMSRREMREELYMKMSTRGKADERVDSYTSDRFKKLLCRSATTDMATSPKLKDARWFGLDHVKKLENIHPRLKRFLIEGFENDAPAIGGY